MPPAAGPRRSGVATVAHAVCCRACIDRPRSLPATAMATAAAALTTASAATAATVSPGASAATAVSAPATTACSSASTPARSRRRWPGAASAPTARPSSRARSAERHLGDPLRPFFALYREPGRRRGWRVSSARASTATAWRRRRSPACPRRSPRSRPPPGCTPNGPLNVVRVGGGGYSVLTRDAAGHVRYEANERCSAGTGETVEGLCSRLGRTLDEAVALAEAQPDSGVTVTRRCAVFAKSELTHFANQGEDARPHLPRALRGRRAQRPQPLRQEQGRRPRGARRARGPHRAHRRRASASSATAPVEVVAAGRRVRGARRVAATPPRAAPGRGHRRPPRRRGGSRSCVAAAAALVRLGAQPHRPAGARGAAAPGSVIRLERRAGAPRAPADDAPAGVVLGLDLGSTGSKGALLDPRHGAVLADVYRRTEGNPVEAAQALVAEVDRDARPDARWSPSASPAPAATPPPPCSAPPIPELGGAPHGAERDRRPRRGRRALRPRRRPQPLDRRDRRPGRQVHQRRERTRASTPT